MTKYLLRRVVHGLVSVIIVVAIVMILIYSCLDKQLIFAQDPVYTQLGNNQKVVYQYRKWVDYGYIDYVPYTEWLQSIAAGENLTPEQITELSAFGKKESEDSESVAEYVARFTEYYESQGYTVTRLDAKMSKKKVAPGGQQQLYAYKSKPLMGRLWNYLTGLIKVDNIHYVQEDIGERGLTFTLHDPLYGGEKFAPAIIGNGTLHKYLLYTDSRFPFIHQNLVTINLGKSYTVNSGVDVFESMNAPQGSYVSSVITYPTGHTESSADDLHSATYAAGSREANLVNRDRFTDDYTSVVTVKSGLSQIGYSFVIGIIAVALRRRIGLWTRSARSTSSSSSPCPPWPISSCSRPSATAWACRPPSTWTPVTGGCTRCPSSPWRCRPWQL